MSRLLVFLFALLAAVPAHAAIGEWQAGDHVRLRLIAARSADGALDGIVEMELDPGWKTYWRSPGDSGIPPRLDFSASTGVSDPAIDFPAPERSDDGFAVSNVYHGKVALPFRFATAVAAAPIRLELAADLGVCDEICLPVSLKAGLDVPPGESDAAAAARIAEARAALPGQGRPGEFEILSLKRAGGTDKLPVFEAAVRSDGASAPILFAETPADWYPAAPMPTGPAKSGEATFRFEVDRKTATTPLGGATIRLTLKNGDAATERLFHLDANGLPP
jgi:suppressor for copper-sensitivity B